MRAFPDVLKSVFTVSREISPSDVSYILKAASSLEGERVLRIWNYLLTFIWRESWKRWVYNYLQHCCLNCLFNSLLIIRARAKFSSCSVTVLRDFVQFATGCRDVQGNRINVQIQQKDEYIVSHTCSREIVISTRIESFDAFKAAMLAVISDKNFTMV